MGLGKTIQVLALLEKRRSEGGTARGPSLVVVPRSLIFNWLAEADRFTPELHVLDHTGIDRTRHPAAFAASDLVLTTYGTLRRDIGLLSNTEFDYLIFDEAQAIKNAGSETAKAARLLKGRHRLALTGTPIENHLGELWSLLELLNPGMLGTTSVLQKTGTELRNPDPETRTLLSRAVRPIVLRRTKQQVAAELLEKIEQTIWCELPPKQRKLYDELRDHFRASLGARVTERGLGRVKILVLEALLRLRQAACHPALLDRRKLGEPSAKLDALLPQLKEVVEEGHKALVFSQFTSFLALVRAELDREGLTYAYLDGQTRDRQAQVERFQTDSNCPLFLISLKAGGVGLNLTAADTVIHYDPWWNPAVEAQATDRAHRIGQDKPVFVYKLICRGTVEEKIQALQGRKADLAQAVLEGGSTQSLRFDDSDLAELFAPLI
jgi:SNF2 family DNA or RNA helicase